MSDPGQVRRRPVRSRLRRRRLVVVIALLIGLVVVGAVGLYVETRGPVALQSYPPPDIAKADDAAPAPGSVSPEDFGAVGDGVHDDGPAVQAALDAAHGRTVQLAENATYLSDTALDLPSHTTLSGSRSSVLQFTWENSSAPGAGGPFYLGNVDQLTGNADIVLDGFSIVGGGDGLPAGPMDVNDRNVPSIRLRRVNSFVIRDLDVAKAPGISILYQGCIHGLLEGNHVHDSGRDGITGNSLATTLADITVSDNLIERVGDDGIAIAGATVRSTNNNVIPDDITIKGNRILGWPTDPNGQIIGRGIALLAVTRVTVVGNEVDGTAGAGILVRGSPGDSVNPLTGKQWISSQITITDNTVSGAGRYRSTTTLNPAFTEGNGIEVSNAQLVKAEGNQVSVSQGRDHVVEDCRSCSAGG